MSYIDGCTTTVLTDPGGIGPISATVLGPIVTKTIPHIPDTVDTAKGITTNYCGDRVFVVQTPYDAFLSVTATDFSVDSNLNSQIGTHTVDVQVYITGYTDR